MPNECALCEYLDLISACIMHDIHGEDYCSRAEQGNLEEQNVESLVYSWENEGGK